jgi:hypothetical protein
MGGTQQASRLTIHREAVVRWIERGASFGAVEDAIEDVVDLTQDQKAALWLFAFSLRDPLEQRLDARAHLAAVQ